MIPAHKYANRENGSESFLEAVYHRGLKEIIEGIRGDWLRGTFGSVELYCMQHEDGHLLVFKASYRDFPVEGRSTAINSHARVKYLIADDEHGEDALYMVGCSTRADMPRKMFHEVIAHWPDRSQEQQAAFVPHVVR